MKFNTALLPLILCASITQGGPPSEKSNLNLPATILFTGGAIAASKIIGGNEGLAFTAASTGIITGAYTAVGLGIGAIKGAQKSINESQPENTNNSGSNFNKLKQDVLSGASTEGYKSAKRGAINGSSIGLIAVAADSLLKHQFVDE